MQAANDDSFHPHGLRARLRRYWHRLRGSNHRAVARAAVGGHLAYYSLVFVESHGFYGWAAGFCGIILVIEALLGQGEGHG